jgi:hypothetical protein
MTGDLPGGVWTGSCWTAARSGSASRTSTRCRSSARSRCAPRRWSGSSRPACPRAHGKSPLGLEARGRARGLQRQQIT